MSHLLEYELGRRSLCLKGHLLGVIFVNRYKISSFAVDEPSETFASAPTLPKSSMRFFPLPTFASTAYSSRRWRWRPVPVIAWLLPGGFPHNTVHWVYWGQRHMPLLCQQVQFLANLCRSVIPHRAIIRDSQSRSALVTHQPVPGLHEELVKGSAVTPTEELLTMV